MTDQPKTDQAPWPPEDELHMIGQMIEPKMRWVSGTPSEPVHWASSPFDRLLKDELE